METNEFQVTLEKIQGRTVEDIVVTDMEVVMKFTDGTFLDIYLDQHGALKTSTNKIEEWGNLEAANKEG